MPHASHAGGGLVVGQRALGAAPVVEQRAPASECRDLLAAAGRHRLKAQRRGEVRRGVAVQLPGAWSAGVDGLPLVEQRARPPPVGRAASAASECRDHDARLRLPIVETRIDEEMYDAGSGPLPGPGRRCPAFRWSSSERDLLRWSSSERDLSGGRAASASERVSRPSSRLRVVSRCERRSDGERYGAGWRSAPGCERRAVVGLSGGRGSERRASRGRSSRWSSSERASCRDHDIEGSRNFRNTSPQLPGMPAFPARDCRWSMPEFPVWQRYSANQRRTRSRPWSPRPTPTSTSSPTSALVHDARPSSPTPSPRAGRAAAPGHRARARASPTTPTASTSAPTPAPPTPAPAGPTPPGRPNATPSAAWRSRTPWTATTSRSGTRWPPARSPRTRPR